MQETSIVDDLATDVFEHIMNYNNHWSLINSGCVSKKWHTRLAPSFDSWKAIYGELRDQNAEAIIEKSKASVQVTQIVLMADTLLKKLTLDQLVMIVCSSHAHAEILFKSKIFHDKPLEKPMRVKGPPLNEHEQMILIIESIMKAEFQEDIFDHIFPSSLFMSEIDTQKLSRPDLLEEECALEHPPSTKTLCRNYIARAVAEMNVAGLKLVASSARYVLNKKRLVKIAKINLQYAETVLEENISKGKLDAEIMRKISSISPEHKTLVFKYLVNLLCQIPVQLIKQHPQNAKKLAMMLVKNTFYHPSNPIWLQIQKTYPEKARRILEATEMIKHERFLPVILMRIISISPDCAKEVLSIANIRKHIDANSLKNLASKNPSYANLVTQFLSNNRSINSADEARAFARR